MHKTHEHVRAGTDDPETLQPVRHHRSLFLSDLHIGARGCRADLFLDFLQHNQADKIYLVGDIFDNWRPTRSNWSKAHDEVIQTLLKFGQDKAQEGVKIVYLPGNHDAFFRRHYGTYFENIEVVEQSFHIASDGKCYLVLHGDCCDVFSGRARWISRIGAFIDGALRSISAKINLVRNLIGMEEKHTIEASLLRVNSLIRYGNGYERRLTNMAKNLDQDGVICGHFHKPSLHENFGVTYANCGDWINSFTAIVEDSDGRLHLIDWDPKERKQPVEMEAMDGEKSMPSVI